jgi:Protein of unknown function (DUF1553)/Protein of unknown function (DUF1549)/Planctomycete cytochrome C
MCRTVIPRWCGYLAAWLAAAASVAAAGPQPEGVAFFERKIRPVLVKECYGCHSASAKALKAGLRLDTRAGVLGGGDSGPAVVPGKPEESLLLDALRYDGVEMPPKGKLPVAIIADFERWVQMGAPDPRDGSPAAGPKPAGIDLAAGRRFWAYQKPRRHDTPEVSDAGWPWGAIDRFILAGLEARGLRPVRDADRTTMIRRLSFDLVGLPPTPDEIDAFVNDPAPDAYERLVDRLLASPHFGERWGRHWLDVVRFAESLTLRGLVLENAWRYRDDVVAAFNADRPFDRFIIDQIAGDLQGGSSWRECRERAIATTFLTLGNTNLEEQDKAQLEMDVIDEQLDTIGKAFLAQTIGCARCHDHKFDPIPTRDYYAMAAILRNTKTLEHANVSRWLEKPLPAPPEQEAAIRKQEAAVAELESRLKAARARAKVRKTSAGKVVSSGSGAAPAAADEDLGSLEARMKRLRAAGPKRERFMSVEEVAAIRETRVHIRGSVHNLGAAVPRGFLQVACDGPSPAMPGRESGRRELAAWLASADNPLTARVIVNRAWHWLFGAGLVRTVDNFGTTGEQPSHPELLDDLAIRFMEDGWSIKAMVRRIVLSRTYRLAAADDPGLRQADPENRLLGRMNRRRLDAECLRDTILQVSGRLRFEMGGPSFPSELKEDYAYKDTGTRRSVYVPVFRNALPEIFQVFDFADPSMVVGRRDKSIVAPQALFLMNHPFVLEQAKQAARRLLAEPGLDDPERISRAFVLALGRPPTEAERQIAREFLATATAEDAWAGVFQALFASADFRYVN